MPSAIVSCGLKEANAIADLHASADTDAWSRASWKSTLSLPTTYGLVAKSKSQDVGFVAVGQVLDEAEILMVAVDPAFRRRGIAGELLSRAMRDATFRGATSMFLEVAADNVAACALYEQAGFVTTGKRTGYYCQGNQRVDALLMTCTLSRADIERNED